MHHGGEAVGGYHYGEVISRSFNLLMLQGLAVKMILRGASGGQRKWRGFLQERQKQSN